jgi:hypothetical protein
MANYTSLPHTHNHLPEQKTHKPAKGLVHIQRKSDTLLSVEALLKEALTRTVARLFPYLLTQLLFIVVLILTGFLFVLHGGAHIFLYFLTGSLPLTLVSGIFFFVVLSAGSLYFLGWTQLTSLSVLISRSHKNLARSFSETKPYIWNFLWFQGVMGAFIFGLLPLHIVSFFTVFIAWQIWALFSYIIFLEDNHPGLHTLWRSYHTVNQRFWDVTGRLIILFLIYAVVILTINIFSTEYSAVSVLQAVLFYITTPFTISYVYEIYTGLPRQKYARPVQGWVYASTAGWIGMATLILYFIISLIYNPQQALDLILTDEFQIMLEQMEQVF